MFSLRRFQKPKVEHIDRIGYTIRFTIPYDVSLFINFVMSDYFEEYFQDVSITKNEIKVTLGIIHPVILEKMIKTLQKKDIEKKTHKYILNHYTQRKNTKIKSSEGYVTCLYSKKKSSIIYDDILIMKHSLTHNETALYEIVAYKLLHPLQGKTIPTLYGIDIHKKKIRLVTEWTGIDLEEFLWLYKKTFKKRLPTRVIGIIWLQCMKALQAIHEQNLTHGDVKLENFTIDERGAIMLIDLTTVCGNQDKWAHSLTPNGLPRGGTVHYADPHILINPYNQLEDPRVLDVYASGKLLGALWDPPKNDTIITEHNLVDYFQEWKEDGCWDPGNNHPYRSLIMSLTHENYQNRPTLQHAIFTMVDLLKHQIYNKNQESRVWDFLKETVSSRRVH